MVPLPPVSLRLFWERVDMIFFARCTGIANVTQSIIFTIFPTRFREPVVEHKAQYSLFFVDTY